MIKNYLLTALRNLFHHRVFTAINVVGLAVGMVIFGIFSTSAGIKLKSDKFHKNAENIFAVVQTFQDKESNEAHATYAPSPLKNILISEIPDIEKVTRIYNAPPMTIKSNDHVFFEDKILFTEPEFFEMFSFKLIAGDPETALSKPNSIILSRYNAERFFGEKNPIGKELYVNNTLMNITGVIEDTPRTSAIRYNALISYSSLNEFLPALDSFNEHQITSFVQLKNTSSLSHVNNKLAEVHQKLYADGENTPTSMYLFPLVDFRLKSEHIQSWISSSSFRGIIILFIISALMLFVVSINFINLSVARYIKRVKEIGIRKIIGASRFQLILQFLGESILISLIALPLSLVIFEIGYPILLKSFIGQSMPELMNSAGTSIWHYPFIIKYFFYTSLVVGFISGLYPAIYQSGFSPLKILKGHIQKGKNRRKGNKILIILQFFLAVLLITSATITKDQLNKVVTADYGYNRNNVAGIFIKDLDKSQREIIENEIQSRSDVLGVSASEQLPVLWESPQAAAIAAETDPIKVTVESYGVDYNFVELMEIHMKAGRSFQIGHGDEHSFIINSKTAQKLNLVDPLGQLIKIGEKEGTVIGISDDFILGDVGFEIPATALHLDTNSLNYLLVRYREGTDFAYFTAEIKSIWNGIFPDQSMNITSLDAFFTDTIGMVVKVGNFFSVLGLLAIFFSCLGLLGLTSILVEMRLKEMSIRKVLGASRKSIFWTISKNYLVLVTIANILGVILIHFLWTKVMQTGMMFISQISVFTYIGIFVLTFGIAFLAIASQSYKVVTTNPAKILSYE